MNFVFDPMPIVGLPIAQSEKQFPVRRVYCVGRNYADHAREMGSDPDREPPFFFCKANDSQSIVPVKADAVANLPYPTLTNNLHYEVELVVAIGKDGQAIAVENAHQHIFGYAVGLDMTRRDLQNEMKKVGRPWEIGKAFDYSAPIGELVAVADVADIQNADICLSVNGEVKQQGNINQLIWDIAETIANLSTYFELKAGDLIFTGTPAGVGAVVKGDKLVVEVEGLPKVELVVV
ncbi:MULTISPECIES: fumarylacetoacetate hydrolase family protein [unclassified Moraxella]|uniref:fumarylacetoacetate hydrolase family protein n=1 Tax=unclassified Moraxella TaxID=2685852 RepID=UPI003AF52D2D